MYTWVLTLIMLCSVLYTERDRPYKQYAPDSGVFMITWMFAMSSFAIFAHGLFNLLT
jgi:hypothetical protein